MISEKYLELKLDEIKLAFEYENKKKEEKDLQLEIRQQMREEEKLRKTFEEAQEKEDKYQDLLEKAQNKVDKLTGDKLDSLNIEIKKLKEDLLDAQEKNQRAKSMAQQTKAGHVYVISNIGSFGEDIYKIGVTRRLEPLDRVKELGGASVPFHFDVHSMIYSENAPALESELHRIFDNKRVNLVNKSREFFNVKLDDIEEEVLKISPESNFIKIIEAQQYRESVAIREK